MKNLNQLIAASILVLTLVSCNKDDNNDDHVAAVTDQQVMNEFANTVAYGAYKELSTATQNMHQDIIAFQTNPTAAGLTTCQADWKAVRKTWEQTEAFLFGPAATENIDPRIDTWPVNFVDLETIISSTDVLDETYINALDDALKGFHPAEYLLFGLNGTKTYQDFTPRELEFLTALTLNLKNLTGQLSQGWNPAVSNSFYHDFTTAGNGSTVFPSKQSAFEEMVNAMSGICDEVANGKMGEPFVAQDPSLEESPYSKNSITDFTNNIKGVQNVYLGKFNADGYGLEDMVRTHHLALDTEIKQKIANAISSLNAVTDPFGEAIISQPTQVQNAIDAINALQAIIDDELLPFVQEHIN